jgi:uncharacterized membrane protein YdjX (TVP38/TMEM64 family)
LELHALTNFDQGPGLPHSERNSERLARARRKVAALKGFYAHLLIFVVVLLGLTLVNLVTGPPWWVLWVLFGWGIGVVAHALAVFAATRTAVAEWERRKLREFMQGE